MQKRFLVLFLVILLVPTVGFLDEKQINQPNIRDVFEIQQPVQQEFDILQEMKKNIHRVDLDRDYIADSLETKVGLQDVIILFDSFEDVPTGDIFASYAIKDKMSRLPGIFVTIDTADIDNLIETHPSIALIEADAPMKSHLAYSTTQFGVRSAIWDSGYSGSGSHSIAIMDTGIDNTHIAFADRIIANYNAMDGNLTFPADDAGHGTHVASIAAGQNPSGSNQYTITQRGKIPDSGFIDIGGLLANIPSNSEINIKMDWGSAGIDNPSGDVSIEIVDTAYTSYACGSPCQISDTTGYVDTNVTLPSGDFLVIIGNNGGAQGQNFEISVTIPNNQGIPTTNENRHYGVSPNSKLVNVKVLDNSGSGSSANFVDGINWIINNREVYNISVVNLSLGFDTVIATIDTLIADLANSGIIPVVAAGNSGAESSGIGSPGSAPYAITVGAVNRANEMTYYSSYGNPTTNSKAMKPDVLAPGGSTAVSWGGYDTSYEEGYGLIVAADLNNYQFDLTNDDFTGEQGTSMASPHVAGLAALLAEYLLEQGAWDFNSNTNFLKIKRAILAGTFEAATIGFAREEPPSVDHGNLEPSLDRTAKDYYEGWGVVDAQAAFNAINNTLQLNTTQDLVFEHNNPFGRHSYSWSLNALQSVNYTFGLNVPAGADVDIVIYDANSGPTYQGGDYGDLTVLASGAGTGDEYFGFNPTSDMEVIVTVRMVDSSNTQDIVTLTLSQGEIEPGITIISPEDNAEIEGTSVTVEFTSTFGNVTGYLNSESLGAISNGHVIDNLAEGTYTLNLTLTDPNAVVVSDAHTFTMVAPVESTPDNSESDSSSKSPASETTDTGGVPELNFLDFNIFSSFAILVILPLVRTYYRRKN